MQIDHPILQFKNVSISYTPGKNAVNHVNADIKKNRITAIMGPPKSLRIILRIAS